MSKFNTADMSYKEIRHMLAGMDAERNRMFSPFENIYRWIDQDYAVDGCPEHTLDVYYPQGTEGSLPVIFNVHGGAWIYGSKGLYQYYCMALAEKGYTVINMNYRLAPENRFPSALEDVFTAMQFILDNHTLYHCDVEKFFMVGDSAGAQIISQICALLTNQDYQKLFSFQIPNVIVKAVLLNCGLFAPRKAFFTEDGKLIPPATDYLPADAAVEHLMEQMDVFQYITADFPSAFLMGCSNDPISLTDTEDFYQLLKEKGVTAEIKWYGEDDKSLNHCFHINYLLKASKACMDAELAFLDAII